MGTQKRLDSAISSSTAKNRAQDVLVRPVAQDRRLGATAVHAIGTEIVAVIAIGVGVPALANARVDPDLLDAIALDLARALHPVAIVVVGAGALKGAHC